jgi:hypothetical protein
MPDLPTILYFIAVVGGTAVLGGAIAYGILRFHQRTPLEKRINEAGARRIYDEEEREA